MNYVFNKIILASLDILYFSEGVSDNI